MAKNQITKIFKEKQVGISMKDAYLVDKNWHITKNNLGIPLHRYKDGYAIYQVKDEPWCRVTAYRLLEKYSGGGKYQKSDGVHVTYSRYQKTCK